MIAKKVWIFHWITKDSDKGYNVATGHTREEAILDIKKRFKSSGAGISPDWGTLREAKPGEVEKYDAAYAGMFT